jgi:hypothetical protein
VGEIAVDYENMALIFNPDSGLQEACRHLVCIHGTYCFGGILADGTRRAGMALLHWRHACLQEVPADELGTRAEKLVPMRHPGDPAPSDQPFQLYDLRLREKRELAGREMVRWCEQVGWEQAADEEMPYEEHNALGWVIFARRPNDLLPLLDGAVLVPAVT